MSELPNSPASFNSESDSGRALTPVGPSMALPMTPFGLEGSSRPDVIRGGMDPSSLFHSFRRRWLLSLCMGLLVGSAAGVSLFLLFPESSSAVQLFRVNSSTQSVTGTDLAQETDFNVYRRTQQVLITSSYVLNRAMQSPGVANSAFFKGVPDEKRVQHLADELQITFPQDSEIMQIELSGSIPEEQLRTIVKAVSDAYTEEVLFQAKTKRLKPREILVDSLVKINRDIVRKSEQLENILKDVRGGHGSLDGSVDPQTRLLTSEAIQLARDVAEMKQRQTEVALKFEETRAILLDGGLLEQRVDEAIAGLPETQQYEADMLFLKIQIRDVLLATEGPRAQSAIRPLQERLARLSADFERYKSDTKRRMLDEHRSKPNSELALLSRNTQRERGIIAQQVKVAEERIDEITETLRERGQTNTDLLMRQNEIEGLREVANSIAQRISRWDVEAGAESRIQPIPGIDTNKGINKLQRYAIAGFGGLACFALTCFGISYLEFRNRRLNDPEQIDEGLGIRVIGTLPGLPGGRALDSRHPLVAQLTESIDSVRTALMHESTSNRRQIVMVTSAATSEGRTTVASQLAASLARAGRRTLLIDGDLRRPALHNLFDVPLEDGLCEVLRAESDVADVVRPTHAEGLWLITAGYVDPDAVHALATDQVQPIFEKLRADYDYIIIDGAPVLGLSDSLLFGQHCDGTILSVLRDQTAVPKIHQSAQLLKSVGIRLMGCVVNGMVSKADRRVTHLQAIAPKSAQKQLENVEA